jgi:hypothetical protein
MDKTDLLAAVRAAHAPIAAAVVSLSDEALLVVPVDLDGWTRKDVLAHLEHWHRYATALVVSAASGVNPFPDTDDADIDTENARAKAANEGRSADDVRQGFAASFAELVAAVDAASDHELFDEDVQPWIEGATADEVTGDTTAHYAKHAAHLGARLRDKSAVLDAMRGSHGPIAAAIGPCSDVDLAAAAPGMPGWTRKDVVAHIEWWHRHSTAVLAGLHSGLDPYPDEGDDWNIDVHNARVLAENRDRSAADVRAGEAASFEELLATVEGATDHELFDEGVQLWFGQTAVRMVEGDTWDHYPEHVPHLAG